MRFEAAHCTEVKRDEALTGVSFHDPTIFASNEVNAAEQSRGPSRTSQVKMATTKDESLIDLETSQGDLNGEFHMEPVRPAAVFLIKEVA